MAARIHSGTQPEVWEKITQNCVLKRATILSAASGLQSHRSVSGISPLQGSVTGNFKRRAILEMRALMKEAEKIGKKQKQKQNSFPVALWFTVWLQMYEQILCAFLSFSMKLVEKPPNLVHCNNSNRTKLNISTFCSQRVASRVKIIL